VRPDLNALGLDDAAIDKLVGILEAGTGAADPAAGLDALKAALGAGSPAVAELRSLFALCDAHGVSEWVTFDPSIVRGLSYYTGVVFEAFDRKGELRAISGGGRYDRLISDTFGGEPLPAVGFGFGDAVIMELLQSRGLVPEEGSAPGPQALVVATDPALAGHAAAAAAALRKGGVSCDLVLAPKKFKWIFKQADRIRAKHVVLASPDEFEDGGKVAVKRLSDGRQVTVSLGELAGSVDDEVVEAA